MKTPNIALRTVAACGIISILGFRASGVEVGAPAPNFTLPATTGKTFTLDAFKGKFVVLEWTNNGCPYVRKHYGSGNMQALQKWATEKGVIWLSIVSSAEGKQGYVTAEEGQALVKSQGINSTAYLLDPQGRVGRLYGAKSTPHMFVIDPKGTVIYNGAIDDTPTARPADIKTAKNYVRAALEEALSGKPVSIATSQPYGCSMKY